MCLFWIWGTSYVLVLFGHTGEKTVPPSSKSSLYWVFLFSLFYHGEFSTVMSKMSLQQLDVSQFYLLFYSRGLWGVQVGAEYSSGTCKCEVLVKNEQVQAARQETAGGRQKIFLCGVLVSLLNSLDNNACGEAIRYRDVCTWRSGNQCKERRSAESWVYLHWSLIQLNYGDVSILQLIYFLKNLFIVLPELKMNPSAVRLHQTDLLSSVGWSVSVTWFYAFPLIGFFFHFTAKVLPQALPQPVPRRDIQGAIPHLRRSRPRDRVREGRARWDVQRWEKRKDLTVVIMCMQTGSETLCSSE